MKILIVSSYLPFPLFSGGHIRLFNLLKELSYKHEITLVCEKRDYQKQSDIQEVEKICKNVFTVNRRKQWSIKNILKTGFSMNPFLIVGHTNLSMKRKIKDLLQKEKFDVLHAETFYIMQNIPKTKIPIVLAEHNIEYMVYKRFADSKPFFIKLPFYVDVIKMKRLEENFWKKADKLIAVSEEEKRLMNRKDVVVIPNGVDIEKFQPKADRPLDDKIKNEKRVLFIGDFKWMQNRDAALWILKEIWPEIKSKITHSTSSGQSSKLNLKLWVVGRNIPESIKKLGDESVIFDENNQQETQDIFKDADLLLAPIRIGGGTSFKILEAMANGCVVVATPLGREGIDAKDNKEILVADNVNEIAEKSLNILEDKNFYEKIAKNARLLIEEKYSWTEIAKRLESVYNSTTQ